MFNILLGLEDYKMGFNVDKRIVYLLDLFVIILLGDVDFILELYKYSIYISE